MLEGAIWVKLRMAWQVDLTILANYIEGRVRENLGVEPLPL